MEGNAGLGAELAMVIWLELLESDRLLNLSSSAGFS